MDTRISRSVLTYPKHQFRPEDLLNFLELPIFTKAWDKECGYSDDDLAALQLCIMADPEIGQVIPGTDGLRKMRFARESDNVGKRGGTRVLYVHFPDYALGLLVYAYRKGSQEDIDEDDKRFINRQIRRVREVLERRSPLS